MQDLLLFLIWSLCHAVAVLPKRMVLLHFAQMTISAVNVGWKCHKAHEEMSFSIWTGSTSGLDQTLYLRHGIAAVLTFSMQLCAGPAAAVSSSLAAAALCSLYCDQSAIACLLGPHYVVSVDGSGYWQCKFLLCNHSSLVCMAGKL